MPNHPGQGVEKLLPAHPHFVVFRPDMLGYLSRVTELAECLFAVADGEGLNAISTNLFRQRRDRARIQASAEEHAKRNVAHQVRRNGAFQQLPVCLYVVLPRTRLWIHYRREIPI